MTPTPAHGQGTSRQARQVRLQSPSSRQHRHHRVGPHRGDRQPAGRAHAGSGDRRIKDASTRHRPRWPPTAATAKPKSTPTSSPRRAMPGDPSPRPSPASPARDNSASQASSSSSSGAPDLRRASPTSSATTAGPAPASPAPQRCGWGRPRPQRHQDQRPHRHRHAAHHDTGPPGIPTPSRPEGSVGFSPRPPRCTAHILAKPQSKRRSGSRDRSCLRGRVLWIEGLKGTGAWLFTRAASIWKALQSHLEGPAVAHLVSNRFSGFDNAPTMIRISLDLPDHKNGAACSTPCWHRRSSPQWRSTSGAGCARSWTDSPYGRLNELVEARVSSPGDDILSRIANLERDGRPLARDDLFKIVVLPSLLVCRRPSIATLSTRKSTSMWYKAPVVAWHPALRSRARSGSAAKTQRTCGAGTLRWRPRLGSRTTTTCPQSFTVYGSMSL